MNTVADKMGFQWTGIEWAMRFPDRNPAFRPPSSRWSILISTSLMR
jgi:hypothetical protein